MPIICWGNLAKSADDTLRIEQSIQDYVEGHDENPNAHMGPDYALGAHRLAVMLDHAPYSVRNLFVYPQARTYKAIVDPAGFGDQTDLQAAIDYVNSLGGGAIYIKPGTYNISSDLVLYSNIQLIGEDDDTVIFNFGSSYARVLIAGVVGSYKRNVVLEKINFKGGEYDDPLIYLAYVDNVTIEGCKFTHAAATTTNSGGWIHVAANASRIFIKRNRFLSGTHYIFLPAGSRVWITENYFYYSQRNGIYRGGGSHVIIRNNVFENMTQNAAYEGSIYFDVDIVNLHIEGNQFINCKRGVIYLTNMIRSIVVDNRVDGTGGTTYGIFLDTCRRCVFVSNNLDNFDYDGIYLTAADKNTIVGNVITNCDRYGVNISDAACDKNVVVANVLTDNATAGLNDIGTGTVKDHNAT